ncbi:MAG: hypothetical protein ACJAZS_000656, partial [Alteromonas naphthalenivorans]
MVKKWIVLVTLFSLTTNAFSAGVARRAGVTAVRVLEPAIRAASTGNQAPSVNSNTLESENSDETTEILTPEDMGQSSLNPFGIEPEYYTDENPETQSDTSIDAEDNTIPGALYNWMRSAIRSSLGPKQNQSTPTAKIQPVTSTEPEQTHISAAPAQAIQPDPITARLIKRSKQSHNANKNLSNFATDISIMLGGEDDHTFEQEKKETPRHKKTVPLYKELILRQPGHVMQNSAKQSTTPTDYRGLKTDIIKRKPGLVGANQNQDLGMEVTPLSDSFLSSSIPVTEHNPLQIQSARQPHYKLNASTTENSDLTSPHVTPNKQDLLINLIIRNSKRNLNLVNSVANTTALQPFTQQDNALAIPIPRATDLIVFEPHQTALAPLQDQSTSIMIPEQQQTALAPLQDQSTSLMVPEQQHTSVQPFV